jgi:hypothetical protein
VDGHSILDVAGSGGRHLFSLRNGTYANMTTNRDGFRAVHPPLDRHVHVMVQG